jgi:hypothetical protein
MFQIHDLQLPGLVQFLRLANRHEATQQSTGDQFVCGENGHTISLQ